MTNKGQTLQLDSSTPIPISTPSSAPISRLLKNYLKLIDLYKQHECLWMETHKDFFNFALKDEIWEQIANEMTCPLHPEPDADKCKRIIHKLRYNVQLEQLREKEAIYLNIVDGLPPKLCYSDKFQFLFKHMFDRKGEKFTISIPNAEPGAAGTVPQESLAAKCMRLGRTKSKSHTPISHKLKALENLRNRRRSTLSLTPEAFHQLQMSSVAGK